MDDEDAASGVGVSFDKEDEAGTIFCAGGGEGEGGSIRRDPSDKMLQE